MGVGVAKNDGCSVLSTGVHAWYSEQEVMIGSIGNLHNGCGSRLLCLAGA